MKLHLNDELEAFVSRIDTCVVIGEQDFAVEESEDFFGSVSRVSPLFFDVGIKLLFSTYVFINELGLYGIPNLTNCFNVPFHFLVGWN